jgi:hypothetical protein
MSTALISLASSVVGGLLVIAGQLLLQRRADQRYWLGLLREAAVGVSTSFSQERAQLTFDRGRGKATSRADETSYIRDRQRAVNRLLTLPRGESFESYVSAMGKGIEDLWQVYSASEEDWQAARVRLLEAIKAFNVAVRNEMPH